MRKKDKRGRIVPSLTEEDMREIRDLYKWGMLMKTLALYYDVDRGTIHNAVQKMGLTMRKGRQRLPDFPKHIRSNRPGSHGFVVSGRGVGQDIDLLVHEHARALQDKRTGRRQGGASTRSYRGAAYGRRRASSRSGSPPQALG